jgi:hypothetical protein
VTEYQVRYTYDPGVLVEDAEIFAHCSSLDEAVLAATKITGGAWRAILAVEAGQPRQLTRGRKRPSQGALRRRW